LEVRELSQALVTSDQRRAQALRERRCDAISIGDAMDAFDFGGYKREVLVNRQDFNRELFYHREHCLRSIEPAFPNSLVKDFAEVDCRHYEPCLTGLSLVENFLYSLCPRLIPHQSQHGESIEYE
jgi:hypothetical protein